MSKPVAPGWPESGVFPFMSFPLPGTAASAPSNAAAPLMQGLTGGIDLIKDFWGRLPGGAPLPGFMVPTIDVEELDKRIGDLKAAEAWVEINLNLLRTTIQGLEVQRHTIAAIRSLATPVERPANDQADALPPAAPKPTDRDEAAPAATNAAAHWLGYLQDQFAKVAEAAMTTSTPTTTPSARKPVVRGKKAKSASKPSRKAVAGA